MEWNKYQCVCNKCGYVWDGVIPDNSVSLECPSCHRMNGEKFTKLEWTFWLELRINRDGWFKWFWKSRGSNCLSFVIFNYIHGTIGLPWLIGPINSKIYDCHGVGEIYLTNRLNRNLPFSFTINQKVNNSEIHNNS